MIDFVSVLPFDVVEQLWESTSETSMLRLNRVLRLLRVLKILRMMKGSRILSKLHDLSGLSFAQVSMIKFISSTIFLLHLMACFWAYDRSSHTGMHALPRASAYISMHALPPVARSTLSRPMASRVAQVHWPALGGDAGGDAAVGEDVARGVQLPRLHIVSAIRHLPLRLRRGHVRRRRLHRAVKLC